MQLIHRGMNMVKTVSRKSLYLVAISLFACSTAMAEIEEITVTATKRAESIQDVPISISAYSGDFLENSDIRTLQDLSLYAPNFTMAYSSQATNARIFIRGVGSVGNSGIETSVGVFVDGVYFPRPGSVIGNLLGASVKTKYTQSPPRIMEVAPAKVLTHSESP